MAAVFDVDSLIMNNVCAHTVISQLCLALLDCNCILNIQGGFFNWASPEFAKCWPVSN